MFAPKWCKEDDDIKSLRIRIKTRSKSGSWFPLEPETLLLFQQNCRPVSVLWGLVGLSLNHSFLEETITELSWEAPALSWFLGESESAYEMDGSFRCLSRCFLESFAFTHSLEQRWGGLRKVSLVSLSESAFLLQQEPTFQLIQIQMYFYFSWFILERKEVVSPS